MGNETRKETLSNQTRRENIIPQTGEVQYSDSKYHELLAPIIPQGYSVLELLSTAGGESDVYLIANGPHKEVIKLYRQGIDIKEATLQELKSLSEEYPEHLVKIYEVGYHTEAGRWYERMEYIPFGNLREFFPYGYGGKKLLDAVFDELKSALVVLHNNNLIHRDLKPENIMVRTKHPLDLVFADFGMSSSLDINLSRKMTMTVGGTFDYMAPESFMSVDGQTITGKGVDIWALGIIIYEMITGQTPFAGINPMMIGHKLITEGIIIDEEVIPIEFHDYIPLLERFLSNKQNNRKLFTNTNEANNYSVEFDDIETSNEKDNSEIFVDIKTPDYSSVSRLISLELDSLSESYKFLEALVEAKKRVNLSIKKNGEDHIDTIFEIYNLGIVYNELMNYSKAEELFEDVYTFRKNKFGENCKATISSKKYLEKVRKSQMKYKIPELSEKYLLIQGVLEDYLAYEDADAEEVDDDDYESWTEKVNHKEAVYKNNLSNNIEIIESLAKQNIPAAQLLLGIYFLRNKCIDYNTLSGNALDIALDESIENEKLGRSWVIKAADQDFQPAIEFLEEWDSDI